MSGSLPVDARIHVNRRSLTYRRLMHTWRNCRSILWTIQVLASPRALPLCQGVGGGFVCVFKARCCYATLAFSTLEITLCFVLGRFSKRRCYAALAFSTLEIIFALCLEAGRCFLSLCFFNFRQTHQLPFWPIIHLHTRAHR